MLQISSTALIINLSVHLLKMGCILEIITDEVRRNCWRFKKLIVLLLEVTGFCLVGLGGFYLAKEQFFCLMTPDCEI